jgi:serine/threonine protein kinase
MLNLKEGALTQGYIVDNRYEVRHFYTSAGGFNEYIVTDETADYEKILIPVPAKITENESALKFLLNNTEDKSWLKHPNIQKTLDFANDGNIYFFVAEYIPGILLPKVLSKIENDKLSEKDAIILARQIIDGLVYLHNNNLLHNDLTINNIIITNQKKAVIKGSGYSDILWTALNLSENTVDRRNILYMSPEHLRGKNISAQSDIYSFGALLYVMLSGKPPFFRGDVYHQILSESPEKIENVSSFMNKIVQICLQKEPEKRFKSAEEILKLLQPKKKENGEENAYDVQSISEPNIEEKYEKKPFIINVSEDDEPEKFDTSVLPIMIEHMKKSWKTILGIIAVGLMVAAINRIDFSSSEKAKTNIKHSAPQNEYILKKRHIADSLFKAGRYLSPKNQNAAAYYVEILGLDKNNEIAKKNLKTIQQKVLNESLRYLKQKRVFLADSVIQMLANRFYGSKSIDSVSKMIKETIRQNNEVELQVEILNGAGVSKIALKTARQVYPYWVIHTENYRVNGKINWSVEKSFVVSKIGDSDPLKNLMEKINMPYRQIQYDKEVGEKGNVVIVLGKDYQKLLQ